MDFNTLSLPMHLHVLHTPFHPLMTRRWQKLKPNLRRTGEPQAPRQTRASPHELPSILFAPFKKLSELVGRKFSTSLGNPLWRPHYCCPALAFMLLPSCSLKIILIIPIFDRSMALFSSVKLSNMKLTLPDEKDNDIKTMLATKSLGYFDPLYKSDGLQSPLPTNSKDLIFENLNPIQWTVLHVSMTSLHKQQL